MTKIWFYYHRNNFQVLHQMWLPNPVDSTSNIQWHLCISQHLHGATHILSPSYLTRMTATTPKLVSLSLPLLPFKLFSNRNWCDPVTTMSTHSSAHKSPKASHSNGFPIFFQNKKTMFCVPKLKCLWYGFHISYFPYSLCSSHIGLLLVLNLTSTYHLCTCHPCLVFCLSKYFMDCALTFLRLLFKYLFSKPSSDYSDLKSQTYPTPSTSCLSSLLFLHLAYILLICLLLPIECKLCEGKLLVYFFSLL